MSVFHPSLLFFSMALPTVLPTTVFQLSLLLLFFSRLSSLLVQLRSSVRPSVRPSLSVRPPVVGFAWRVVSSQGVVAWLSLLSSLTWKAALASRWSALLLSSLRALFGGIHSHFSGLLNLYQLISWRAGVTIWKWSRCEDVLCLYLRSPFADFLRYVQV